MKNCNHWLQKLAGATRTKKLQPLVGEMSWSKNLIIMEKCKDDLQREFYIRMTRKLGCFDAGTREEVLSIQSLSYFLDFYP